MATTYIVLREQEGGTLTVLGTADVDTPRQAIKTFSEPAMPGSVSIALPEDVQEGGYVTVPLRNWTEEEVEVETRVTYRTRDRFAEAETLPPEEEPEAQELAAVIGGVGIEPGEAA